MRPVRLLVGIVALLPFPVATSQEIIHTWDGSSARDSLGHDVADVGDVNGDGVTDVAATAPNPQGGYVRVFSGATGEELFQFDPPVEDGDRIGGIDGAGDVNADGFDDIIVGLPLAVEGRGRVYVLSGLDLDPIHVIDEVNVGDQFGVEVSGVGDIDGDGFDDFAAGAAHRNSGSADQGSISVYSGRSGSRFWRVYGDPRERLGYSIDGLGDISGDGLPEIIVGAPFDWEGDDNLGRAFVFSAAGQVLFEFKGEAYKDRFGFTVSGMPDHDNDGVPDIAVGAPFNDAGGNEAGRIYTFSGRTGDPIHVITGPGDFKRFGHDMDGAQDFDGDGAGDLVVLSLDAEILLLSGASGTESLRVLAPDGTSSLSAAADLDGDGLSDFLFGNTSDDTAAENAGRVWAYSSSLRPRVFSITPTRTRYTETIAATITGKYFELDTEAEVRLGLGEATNVVIVDDTTITCNVPITSQPGPVPVSVQNSVGVGELQDGFTYTPALEITADAAPGTQITITYLLDPGDSILGVYGLPPKQSIDTPPFGGTLCILPLRVLFIISTWPFDEFTMTATIPNDPALSGLQVLLQGLIGPSLVWPGKDAAWTNCGVLDIQ